MFKVITLCVFAMVCAVVGVWADIGAEETTCPALISTPGQLNVCHLQEEIINCTVPAPVGTVAVLICERDFVVNIEAGQGRVTTCREGGQWNRTLTPCLPEPEGECGRQNVSGTLVVKGETVVAGLQPWHVYIFGSVAGTLVSRTHVVTNAFSVCAGDTTTPLLASDLSLTAGQLVEWSDPAGEPHSQTRGVQSVLIHPEYTGGYAAAHDIALLVADASFDITPAVNVACVDWSGLFRAPTASDVIIVAAWEHGKFSSSHEVTSNQRYSYVARQQCRYRAKSDRQSGITDDKVCAVSTGRKTCMEYDGTGLMVERDTSGEARYFLTGVNSVWLSMSWRGGVCHDNRLRGFTDVAQHISWLKQHVSPPT